MAVGSIYIIGAGIAGLSVATALAEKGKRVIVHEAARHGGGRCRSFFENTLGCRIDNGNHLLLSGNFDVNTYLNRIGAKDSLVGPKKAIYPFVNIEDKKRWVLDISLGRFPWWVFSSNRRVPKTTAIDYLRAIKLANAKPTDTVGILLDDGSYGYRVFWEPLTESLLNTPAQMASANLLWAVIKESLCRGAASCQPMFVREGLSETFVDPALHYLIKKGTAINFNSRLRDIEFLDKKVKKLIFSNRDEELGEGDKVILALPPNVVASLLPNLKLPNQYHSIINGHFQSNKLLPGHKFIGAVGGTVQWVFSRDKIISVTVSAADNLVDKSSSSLAKILWHDIVQILGLQNSSIPLNRIIKEKHATFSQNPQQIGLRPKAQTAWENLFLAGDWTETKLPATIEGAVRSGRLVSEIIN